PAGRMCSNDGRCRRAYDVPERRIRHVRNVYHHSQAIHFAHDALAKLVEPARGAGIITRRTGPTGAYTPRRRHVSHTEIVIALHVLQSVVDCITTFETQQRRY